MLPRRAMLLTLPAMLLMAPVAGRAASPGDQVKDAYAAWDGVFNKGDAKALAALYADDAIVLPPSHDVVRGPAEIEKFFAALFANGVTGHHLELIEANGSGDVIVSSAKWSARTKDAPIGGLATHEFEKQANGGLKLRLHTFN